MFVRDLNNITTAAVIFNTNCTRILLIQRRSDEIFPLQIALPGGRVREGEDASVAAKREVREEVGLEIDSMNFLGVYFAGEMMLVAYVGIVEEYPPKCAERISFWIDLGQIPADNLAPNVQDVIKHALQYVKIASMSKTLSRLGEAIEKGYRYVLEHTSTKEGYIGWDHFLGQGRIGNIGTALGVLILCRGGIRSHCIDEAVTYLKDNVSTDGGWGIRSIMDTGEEISITESTLYALDALICAGVDHSDRSISNGIDWLSEMQHSTGGWGSARFRAASSPHVFTTAFAISVLSGVNYDCKKLENAIDWLRAAQKPDGSWGAFSFQESPRQPGSATHTARSILALLDYPELDNRLAIDRGIRWLIKSYNPKQEQGWSSSSRVVFVSNKSRLDFKHFATPWVLVALIRSGVKLNELVVVQPLVALLDEQTEEGYWTHHLVCGQIPIWATHDSLMALSSYRNSLWKEAGDLVLYSLLKEKHDQLLSSFVLRESSRSKISGGNLGHASDNELH